MHVSMLAGLPPTSSAYSEHKARVATALPPTFRRRCCGALLERSAECSNSSATREAFHSGSSIGTAQRCGRVPVAIAGRVACDADERREASRDVYIHSGHRFYFLSQLIRKLQIEPHPWGSQRNPSEHPSPVDDEPTPPRARRNTTRPRLARAGGRHCIAVMTSATS